MKVLRANMLSAIRQSEYELIKNADYVPPPEAMIEWGDLFLDKAHHLMLVGIGYRTNMDGAKWLQSVVGTDYEVVPILTVGETLHLDCVFSLVGKLLYPDAIEKAEDIELLHSLYSPLKLLTEKQTKKLLANLISVSSKEPHLRTRLIGSPSCPVSKTADATITTVNLSELIKVDGAHRCSIAPLI